MSTIVTKTQPLSVTTGSPPNNWQDISELTGTNNVSDMTYCYYEFTTGSNPTSELYIRDWQFDIPVDSVIEDITLTIERTFLTDNVHDSEIKLHRPNLQDDVFNTANLTINYASISDWLTNETKQYTGTWNKTWTGSHINSENFGCWIKVEADSAAATALIDFVDVQVTYHQEIIINPTGGSVCGGSAEIAFIDICDTSGGIVVGGTADAPYTFPNYDGTGGTLAGGTSEPTTEVSTSGGVVVSGNSPIEFGDTFNGGIIVGGEATIEFIDQFDGTGGVVLGSSALVSSGVFGIGGVLVAGDSTNTVINSFDGSSGVVVSGEAIVDPIIGEGGATVGGFVEETIVWSDPSEFGGVVIGGLPLIINNEFVEGGMISSGLATVDRVITLPDWELDLEGSQVVPPIDSTATAHAEFWYDPTERNLSWKITYSGFEETVSVARIRQGQPGETGNLKLDLFEYVESNTATELTGMAQIDSLLESDLASGNSYLMFGSTSIKLRTQFWHFGTSLGGEASVEPYYEIPEGGAVLGGEAVVDPIWGEGGVTLGGTAIAPFINEYTPEGGVIIGGVSGISGEITDTTGGIIAGGESIVVQIEGSIVTSGGLVAGGEASEIREQSEIGYGGIVCGGSATLEYIASVSTDGGVLVSGTAIKQSIFDSIVTGGIVVAGLSPIGIGVSVGGGIIAGGTHDQSYTYNPVISGGIVSSGLASQTFIDYFVASGGAKIGGRTIADKIKFFTKFKTGYCRALKSDNICKVENQGEQLLLPPGSQTAEIDPNRFRIEYLPTWCELDEKLQPYRRIEQPKDCDAALAIIIKKRQKGIIPPKSGREQIRDRGIAYSGETVDAI